MKPPLLTLLTLSASALVGWWAGHAVRAAATNPSDPSAANAPVVPVKPQVPKATVLVRPAQDGILLDRWEFAQEVSQANAVLLPDLLKRARAYTDPNERLQRTQFVAIRYAELEPAGTMTQALEKDQELALLVVAAWAGLDGAAAAEWVNLLGDLQDRVRCQGVMFRSFAQADPLRCLETIAKMDPVQIRQVGIYESIFTSLALQDPAAAIARLPGVKNPVGRLEGFAAVASVWARRDPAAALAWAKGLEEPHERANALQAAVRVQAETDPKAAIQGLNLIDPAGKPAGTSPHAAIAAGLARQDFAAAVQWVKSLDPRRHDLELLLTQSVLAEAPNVNASSLVELFRGVDVAGRASDFSDIVNMGSGLLGALMRWHPQDVKASLQEVSALPSGEARDCVLNYLCWKLSKDDAAAALSLAATADESTQERLAGHLARSLAEEGKITELAQAMKLAGTGGPATVAARDAAGLLAKNYPERGAEFLQLLAEDLRPAAAAKMLPSLVARDPATALALAATLPAEEQPQQLGVVASEWAKLNSTASMRWAQTLPAGPQRDAAAASLAGTLLQKEPSNAFTWAQAITDPEQRTPRLQSVINEWLFQDAVAAQAALKAANLTPEELAQVLKPVETGHPDPKALDRDNFPVNTGDPVIDE